MSVNKPKTIKEIQTNLLNKKWSRNDLSEMSCCGSLMAWVIVGLSLKPRKFVTGSKWHDQEDEESWGQWNARQHRNVSVFFLSQLSANNYLSCTFQTMKGLTLPFSVVYIRTSRLKTFTSLVYTYLILECEENVVRWSDVCCCYSAIAVTRYQETSRQTEALIKGIQDGKG